MLEGNLTGLKDPVIRECREGKPLNFLIEDKVYEIWMSKESKLELNSVYSPNLKSFGLKNVFHKNYFCH